jgi:hypothetical protein
VANLSQVRQAFPVGPLVQLQHVVEVAGADLQVAPVGGQLAIAQELGFVGFGQGLGVMHGHRG